MISLEELHVELYFYAISTSYYLNCIIVSQPNYWNYPCLITWITLFTIFTLLWGLLSIKIWNFWMSCQQQIFRSIWTTAILIYKAMCCWLRIRDGEREIMEGSWGCQGGTVRCITTDDDGGLHEGQFIKSNKIFGWCTAFRLPQLDLQLKSKTTRSIDFPWGFWVMFLYHYSEPNWDLKAYLC